jgi:hypothetical protein
MFPHEEKAAIAFRYSGVHDVFVSQFCAGIFRTEMTAPRKTSRAQPSRNEPVSIQNRGSYLADRCRAGIGWRIITRRGAIAWASADGRE